MVFTTTLFTYFFFPAIILFWLIARALDKRFKKTRLADIVQVLAGFAFFAHSNLAMHAWLFIFISAVYIFALLIEQAKANKQDDIARKALIAALVALVLLLGYYKYSEFTISIINALFKTNIVLAEILAPLGISFISFSAISYLADIYQKKAKAGSFLDCALYLAFFPKLISGPIVLWRDFAKQIEKRVITSDLLHDAVIKISCGFAKKLILADTFGSLIAEIDAGYNASGIDSATAFLAVILYWLQIYYDFSGYSDIAIGISQIFGFKFKPNFNYPYISSSIAEFWRRWHISLGSWFKEYVYIPLGGSRRGKKRKILNLAIVFTLTGIWHGAGYNYIVWGAANALFVIFDHLMKENKNRQKIPRFFNWLISTLITLASWQLFRFNSLKAAYSWFCVIIGRNTFENITYTWRYFYDRSTITFMLIAVSAAILPGLKPVKARIEKAEGRLSFEILRSTTAIALFILAIIFMINSTYSPFIYFQY